MKKAEQFIRFQKLIELTKLNSAERKHIDNKSLSGTAEPKQKDHERK